MDKIEKQKRRILLLKERYNRWWEKTTTQYQTAATKITARRRMQNIRTELEVERQILDKLRKDENLPPDPA